MIDSVKQKYRTHLLKKRIEERNGLQDFWKNYTIPDNIYDINTAWESVKYSTLVKSCRKILLSVQNAEEVCAYDLANLAKSVAVLLTGLIVTPMIQALNTLLVNKW